MISTMITILLAAVLVICAWQGYKRGLMMGVGALLALAVSIYGANLLATAFSYDVIPALRPFAAGFMEQRIDGDDGAMERMGWKDEDYSLEDLLKQNPDKKKEFCAACYETLGIHESAANIMADEAVAYDVEHEGDTVYAVVQVLCEKVCFVGCFVLAFLLLIILLTVIGNLPNLSYKLPNLDTLNDILGVLLGIAEGLVFCLLIVWLLRFAGIVIGEDSLEAVWMSDKLLEHNFLIDYLGI